MLVEHQGLAPTVHETAYVAPNAVVCGDVRVGESVSILFGAVVTADGGPVTIGSHSVVMENAVVRGTPKNPCRLGSNVLVGPNAHVTGATVEDDVFLATGSAIFNGARLGRGVEVRIHGVVHVNSVVTAGEVVPIGWVAVGDPARILPPENHDAIWEIQKSMDFPGTVFGVDRSVPKGERTRRYARVLTRHRHDRILS